MHTEQLLIPFVQIHIAGNQSISHIYTARWEFIGSASDAPGIAPLLCYMM